MNVAIGSDGFHSKFWNACIEHCKDKLAFPASLENGFYFKKVIAKLYPEAVMKDANFMMLSKSGFYDRVM